jgi:hypothetical protein
LKSFITFSHLNTNVFSSIVSKIGGALIVPKQMFKNFQKAFVELANEEGEDMKAELLIHDGVPRGLYRAETRDWWALGTFLDGLVTTGQLWIIYPTYVR